MSHNSRREITWDISINSGRRESQIVWQSVATVGREKEGSLGVLVATIEEGRKGLLQVSELSGGEKSLCGSLSSKPTLSMSIRVLILSICICYNLYPFHRDSHHHCLALQVHRNPHTLAIPPRHLQTA